MLPEKTQIKLNVKDKQTNKIIIMFFILFSLF